MIRDSFANKDSFSYSFTIYIPFVSFSYFITLRSPKQCWTEVVRADNLSSDFKGKISDFTLKGNISDLKGKTYNLLPLSLVS